MEEQGLNNKNNHLWNISIFFIELQYIVFPKKQHSRVERKPSLHWHKSGFICYFEKSTYLVTLGKPLVFSTVRLRETFLAFLSQNHKCFPMRVSNHHK